ncbi:ParA family protein [Mucilaginibacter sp. P25]|uniref:Chromosome partitioning protein n=1 Tax=Mucilaginibacter gossypiicola TaxID=551995 RepID=A0A1H8AYK6_9SPHI|nr:MULTISPECIES: ParA family protein [Mucilaginibacter]UOE52200.1 ParA family protein [Mucilaginibacter sp. SMC90]SEM75785.1 chromosome partitioning protein [Mucilaginibacter gossypiicola]
MIIIIGNQKGGAGKSTLTLLLANYLTMVKKRKVTVIDMDYQQSIAQKYEKAKVLENEEPYEVVAASLEDYPDLLELIKSDPETLVLIDLPGKLDDDGLLPVFKSADLVICPFAYDEFSFESTILFSVVFKKLCPDCEMMFVPNRIKANVRYDTQSDVDEQLKKFGMVTAAIPDRIDFQRTSTFQTPISVFPAVRPVFDGLYKQHLKMEPNA